MESELSLQIPGHLIRIDFSFLFKGQFLLGQHLRWHEIAKFLFSIKILWNVLSNNRLLWAKLREEMSLAWLCFRSPEFRGQTCQTCQTSQSSSVFIFTWRLFSIQRRSLLAMSWTQPLRSLRSLSSLRIVYPSLSFIEFHVRRHHLLSSLGCVFSEEIAGV